VNLDEYLKLLPPVTDLSRPYWDGCLAGELRLQVCGNCGLHRFPDSYVCPRCLSRDASWEPASGRGTLWSWITIHQKYFEAFADELPYQVAFVHLEEGPYLITGLVDAPSDLRLDQPVEVVFEQVTDALAIPRFRVVR
jgi:uncharacterized protein